MEQKRSGVRGRTSIDPRGSVVPKIIVFFYDNRKTSKVLKILDIRSLIPDSGLNIKCFSQRQNLT